MPWNSLPAHKLAQLPIYQQYFAYANAYFDSAARLCKTLARSTRKASFERGAVVLYLAQHGLELFYKGAILKKAPRERSSHGLPQLQNRYKAIYPAKRYHVKELFRVSYEGLTKAQISQVQGSEPPTDQLYRYPEDKTGKPWQGLFTFEASSFSRELSGLIEQVQSAITHIDA